ncbi:MAG: transcription elongation factor GreA [Candidatus Cloacimonetes bacterium]|nr:transcription elongation factor GreA [Candidatus Cloacimonadota bacterium]
MADYITKEGMLRLRKRMQHLIEVRSEVIKHVVEAREMGDLSENAEYHAAREKQNAVEKEYNHLKKRSSQLMVIDPASISKDSARFGARITMEEVNEGTIVKLQLVGIDEVYTTEDGYERTSILSPRGTALIGKKVGDVITVKAPRGDFSYKILTIE